MSFCFHKPGPYRVGSDIGGFGAKFAGGSNPVVEKALLPFNGMSFGQHTLKSLDGKIEADCVIPPSNQVDVIRHDSQAE